MGPLPAIAQTIPCGRGEVSGIPMHPQHLLESNSIGLLHSPMLCSTRLMQDRNSDDAYIRVRAAAKLAKLNDATEIGIAVRAMGRKARRPYTLIPGLAGLVSPWPRDGILK